MNGSARRGLSGTGDGSTASDFHLRMVWMATAVTWVTIGTVALALLMHGERDDEGARTPVFALLALAAVTNLLAYVVPWRRLIARYSGTAICFVWALGLLSFGSLVVLLFPWLDSQLYLLYFPVILFAIATLDNRSQAIVSTLGIGSYAVAVQLSEALQPSELLLRLAALTLVALLGSYITHEQRETAVENARLYAESRRASEERQRVFSRFGKALASSLELDKTLQIICDLAVETIGAEAAMLVMLDDHGLSAATAVASGGRQDELQQLQKRLGESFVAALVRGRIPEQIPDLAADNHFLVGGADWLVGLGSYVGAPLLLRGRVVGLLALVRARTGMLSASEIELVASFCNQAAVAIENSRLLATLQERLSELSGLHEISLAFASLTKLEDTYGQLVERIARLLDAERCVILLPDQDEHHLVAQAPAYGVSEEVARMMRVSIDERSAAARVWMSGRPYMTNDAQTDSRNLHVWSRAFGDRSLILVPMRVEGKTVGLLRASDKRRNHFTNNDVRLLSIFATHAAVALQNAMLYREVAHHRARLQAIFDHASDGIVMIDRERSIVAFNRAMGAISGWQADEVVGHSCRDVFRPHDATGASLCDVGCPMDMHFDQTQPGPYVESRLTAKDGRHADVGVSYSVLTSAEGEVYGVAIVRDISKAKELDRVKSQFISAVSHELRTPLASIKASIGLLLANVPETTAEPLMRLLQNIDRSTRRLESLVSDLLDLARLQSGRVRLAVRRLDLREVITNAIATIRPLAEEKNQAISIDLPAGPCYAVGDRQRLEQVMLNLLSNANKYTPAGGRISVKAERLTANAAARHAFPATDGRVLPTAGYCVAVQDTGPGIPVGEQEHIFERFYRVEDQDTLRNVGTSLGLSIAKALIALHGGQIWLDSRPGFGSTFYIALPEEGTDEDIGD